MKLLLVILAFSSIQIFSQKIDDIVTDRPDQTESALTVPMGFFQVEMGASIEHIETIPTPLGDLTIQDHAYPSVLLRYGAVKNVELRLGFEYHQAKVSIKNYDELESRGYSPLMLGTKVSIFSEKGARPETALLLHVSFPLGSNRSFQPEYIGTDFRFSMQHELSERFALSYNLGGEWNGDDPRATGLYTLSLGVSLVKNLSAFVESYGFVTQDVSPDHRLDGGITYLFAKNIQADISGGVGLTDVSPDYFFGAGLSIRLPR